MAASLSIDLITLFPGMVSGYFQESILGRAVERELLRLQVHNLRRWTTGPHQVADDRPFGGGAGMVLKPEPLYAAIQELATPASTVIYMAPDGEKLTSALAREMSRLPHLVVISGHYEGIDERVRETLVHREISIGDYVLSNGTLPGAVLIDAVVRFVPGVLGEELSLSQDSFNDNLLSFPQYTRPVEFAGRRVPDILLSGNHREIEKWRHQRRLERTLRRRPDLMAAAGIQPS